MTEGKKCSACGGELAFYMRVRMPESAAFLVRYMEADVFLCPGCGRFELFQSGVGREMDAFEAQVKKYADVSRTESEESQTPPSSGEPPKTDPWEKQGLFRGRKKPDWEK